MKHKLIGLYQLITGVFGAILIVFSLTKVMKDSTALMSFILGLVLFVGVAYAGYALLNNLRNAVKYSIIAQSLQILSFTVGGMQYLFTGSAFIAIVINHGIQIKSQIAPIAYRIAQVSTADSFELRLFVVPVILVLLLSRK